MINVTPSFSPTPLTTRSATFLQRVREFVGAVVIEAAKRWRHRREVRQLAEFDDQMLKDIGLTRSEVEGALAEPFYRDRAVVLVRWNEPKSRRDLVTPASAHARPRVPLVNSNACRA